MHVRLHPGNERIVTIEDAAELQLQQPHVVRLETRPPNIEGKGEVTQRALVRNALRMRPDRIILGEVRGAEALDMLQAMNTGHEGSLATIHANTPRDALSRLENMVGMAGAEPAAQGDAPADRVGDHRGDAGARLTDGKRKMVSIQEITGMEGDVITMQEIFAFRQTGVGPDGEVLGHFQRHRRAAAFRRPPAHVRRDAAGRDVRPEPALRVGREPKAMLQSIGGNSFLFMSVLVFVAVLLLLQGLYLVWKSYKGPDARKLEQRLQALSASTDRTAQAQLLKQRMLSDVPVLQRLLLDLPRAQHLDRFLFQAGLDWTLSKLLLVCAMLAAIGFVTVSGVLHQPPLPALGAAALLASLPLLHVQRLRKRRLARLEQQLPEALDLITRALRSGHSFSSSLQMIGEEMSRADRQRVRDRQRRNQLRRVAAAGARESERTGADHRPALLRGGRADPARIRRQPDRGAGQPEPADPRTPEAAVEGAGCCRPKAGCRPGSWASCRSRWRACMNLFNPEFMSPLWNDPMGITLVQYMLGLMAVGVLILRRIIRIRV